MLLELQLQVAELKTEVLLLIIESGKLKQDSVQLQELLTGLNSDIEKLSESLDRIGTSITSLEGSLKSAQMKSSLGLGFYFFSAYE